MWCNSLPPFTYKYVEDDFPYEKFASLEVFSQVMQPGYTQRYAEFMHEVKCSLVFGSLVNVNQLWDCPQQISPIHE